jgi:hypothetical protein
MSNDVVSSQQPAVWRAAVLARERRGARLLYIAFRRPRDNAYKYQRCAKTETSQAMSFFRSVSSVDL